MPSGDEGVFDVEIVPAWEAEAIEGGREAGLPTVKGRLKEHLSYWEGDNPCLHLCAWCHCRGLCVTSRPTHLHFLDRTKPLQGSVCSLCSKVWPSCWPVVASNKKVTHL